MIINKNGASRANGIAVSRAMPPAAEMQISVPTTFANASSQTIA